MQASTFRLGTRVWPFMAYCMYAASIPPGPIETVNGYTLQTYLFHDALHWDRPLGL